MSDSSVEIEFHGGQTAIAARRCSRAKSVWGPFARRVYMWRRGQPVEDRHRPTRYHVARSPLNLAAWALGRAASVFR